jgi:hypothetical protein
MNVSKEPALESKTITLRMSHLVALLAGSILLGASLPVIDDFFDQRSSVRETPAPGVDDFSARASAILARMPERAVVFGREAAIEKAVNELVEASSGGLVADDVLVVGRDLLQKCTEDSTPVRETVSKLVEAREKLARTTKRTM